MRVLPEGAYFNSTNAQKVVLTSSNKAPVTYEIDCSGQYKPSRYMVRTIISDSKGRINATEISCAYPTTTDLVPQNIYYHPPVVQSNQPQIEYVTEETIRITAKQKSYKIGETAELVVQVPFAPCDGMIYPLRFLHTQFNWFSKL